MLAGPDRPNTPESPDRLGAEGLPAQNGLALRSPRYSAEAERGNSRSKRRKGGIGSPCKIINSAEGYSCESIGQAINNVGS